MAHALPQEQPPAYAVHALPCAVPREPGTGWQAGKSYRFAQMTTISNTAARTAMKIADCTAMWDISSSYYHPT